MKMAQTIYSAYIDAYKQERTANVVAKADGWVYANGAPIKLFASRLAAEVAMQKAQTKALKAMGW